MMGKKNYIVLTVLTEAHLDMFQNNQLLTWCVFRCSKDKDKGLFQQLIWIRNTHQCPSTPH